MTDFKPMLASPTPADLNDLAYPVSVSPKLDGIRCIIKDGVAVSRKLKLIPNHHIRSTLAGLPDGWDGELIVKGNFNDCQSAIMRSSGFPDFVYHVFDWAPFGLPKRTKDLSFSNRDALLTKHKQINLRFVNLVPQVIATNKEELLELEAKYLKQGYEGAMVRDIDSEYKYGRSTTKQGILLKLKRFKDMEAKVINTIERKHNANEPTRDLLGRTKRSTAQDGMVPAGDLGALICNTPACPAFQLGTGFSAEERENLWLVRDTLVGRMVKFRYQEINENGIPRFPVFLGFRDEIDM